MAELDYFSDTMFAFEPEPDDFDSYNQFHLSTIWTQYQKGKLLWTTKDHKEILVQDMTDSHLKNMIPFIQRQKKEMPENLALPEWQDVFEAEIKKRQTK